MSKNKQKGEMIAQLDRDIDAYGIQLQRIIGIMDYAKALKKSLLSPPKKEEKKDAKKA